MTMLRQPDTLVEVLAYLVRIICVVERQPISIGQADCHRAPQPRRGHVIDEIRIAEMRHPIERVVSGMIDAIVAAESHVTRWDTEMLQERCVIRTGPQRANARF